MTDSSTSSSSWFASTLDSHHDIVESIPDIPPVGNDGVVLVEEAPKLQKLRIHNERLRKGLQYEWEKYEQLHADEEGLKSRLAKTVQVIEKLNEKSAALDDKGKDAESAYHDHRNLLVSLQSALSATKAQWKKESAEYTEYSTRLLRLKTQMPKLESELADVSNQCTRLADQINAATTEKGRLESVLNQIEQKNALMSSNTVSTSTVEVQTVCDLSMFADMERIRLELDNQLHAMKKVKEALELVRRCT